MGSQKTTKLSILKVFNATGNSLKNQPILFIPFLIFFIFDLISLIILYLAPRIPLSLILGPPIRTFWGEKFLHYPINFLLLPKLASLTRMGLAIFLGSLLTGLAVALVWDIYNKKQLKLKVSFGIALKKYFDLFAIVFIFTSFFYVLQKILALGLMHYFVTGHRKLLFLGPGVWLGPILLALNFLFAVLIQSAFIYAIPLVIIEKEKLIKSLIKSFVLFKKLFIPTVILVGLPMLFYVPIVILESKSDFLIMQLFPESVLLVLVLGCAVSSLVIDAVVTVGTTWLYLMHREQV
jgi:hypothetical protein